MSILQKCIMKRNLSFFGSQVFKNLSQRSVSSKALPLYELRIYNIFPKDFKRFVDLSKQWMHLRLAHSKLLGYWSGEVGGLNDVVHIWEYEGLQHRADVRKGLAEDAAWQGDFIRHMYPLLDRQENCLMVPHPNTHVKVNTTAGGAYVLQTLKDCSTDHINKAVQKQTSPGLSLIGAFEGILGPTKTSYLLWNYAKLDDAMDSTKNISLIADAKESGKELHGGYARLLLPTPWSPLQ